jgi:hypothetical protein
VLVRSYQCVRCHNSEEQNTEHIVKYGFFCVIVSNVKLRHSADTNIAESFLSLLYLQFTLSVKSIAFEVFTIL